MSECSVSPLDLFQNPPVQTAVLSSYHEQIRPVASVSDFAPIEFIVPSSGESYLDLSSTMIKITAKILGPDGTGIARDVMAAPVNNFLHSMFSKTTVSLNGRSISDTTHTYPYKSYIETLLNFSTDTKNGELSASLWQPDTPGKFNNHVISGGGKNEGFENRKRLGGAGRLISMMGRVFDSALNQQKYLIDGVDLRITFFRSKDTFCINRAMPADPSANPPIPFTVQIESAALYVRRINLSNPCQKAINAALKISPAKYDFVRTDMRMYSIPTGVSEWSQTNLVLGQIPRRMIIFFVKTEAFHGNYGDNPFNMENLDIGFMQLRKDGRSIPLDPLVPNFNYDGKDYVRTYMHFQNGLNKSLRNDDIGLSYDDFGEGNTFFIFKLSGEDSVESCSEPDQRGSVDITTRFRTPTQYPVTAFCYREFDSTISITKDREIELDYIV